MKKTGKFLNIPYDFRWPTRKIIKERIWNPNDKRIFIPHVFGWVGRLIFIKFWKIFVCEANAIKKVKNNRAEGAEKGNQASVSAIPRVAELAKNRKIFSPIKRKKWGAKNKKWKMKRKFFLFLATAELAKRAETQIVSQNLALPRARSAR